MGCCYRIKKLNEFTFLQVIVDGSFILMTVITEEKKDHSSHLKVCVAMHVALRMVLLCKFLASRWPFLANRNAELTVPPLF